MTRSTIPVVILVLSLLLSGLAGVRPPSAGAQTDSASSPEATPDPGEWTEPTSLTDPSPRDPKGPYADYADYLLAKVDRGEWSLEVGIVRTLKLLVGEKGAARFNNKKLDSGEASGVVQLAEAYLRDGPDAEAKAEIERLLDIIFPSNATLERISTPAPSGHVDLASGAGTAGTSPLIAVPLVRQQLDCASLWREGFPRSGTGSTICMEYLAETIESHRYRVFYPASWGATAAWGAPYLAVAMDAMRDSVFAYGSLGTMGDVNLVFTELAGSDANADTLATAGLVRYRSDEPCAVTFYPAIQTESIDAFRQSVAHELFHCFQNWNFPDQMQVGPPAYNWWVEGTAEYFSNVVFPEIDYEHRWIGDLDRRIQRESILKLGYENFLFFQYLGTEIGNDGILRLLGRLPASGDEVDQGMALREFPRMSQLFHGFARAYLDRTIADTGGGKIPVNSSPGQVHPVSGPEIHERQFGDFHVLWGRYSFAEAQSFVLSVTAPGPPHRSAARPVDQPGAWGPLPGEIRCDDPRQYLVVLTGVTLPPEDFVTFTNEIATTDAGCDPTPATDDCLVGAWSVTDFGGYAQALIAASLPDPSLNLSFDGASGRIVYGFAPDGTVKITGEGFELAMSAVVPDVGMTIGVTARMDGVVRATYALPGGDRLSLSGFDTSGLTSTIGATMDGSPLFSDVWDLSALFTEQELTYRCTGDSLEIDFLLPNGGTFPLAFAREDG